MAYGDGAMKELLRTLARRCGYEITRYSAETNHTARLVRCIENCGIKTVVDVGANVGQFARGLRAAGFRGRIISIEPQRDAHEALVGNAAKDTFRNWHVMPRVAVGEAESMLDLHIAGNSWSTSLLPMLAAHSDALPSSLEVRVEQIPVVRLDALLRESSVAATPPLLIKMDVQGYESCVLRGATEILPATAAILTEMSLTPLYDGQVLWCDLYDQIIGYGFDIFDLYPGFANPSTGRLLQIDGLFTRSN